MKKEDLCSQLTVAGKEYTIYDLGLLEKNGMAEIARLPFSIRVLLENMMRFYDNTIVTEADIREVGRWKPSYANPREIAFHPARVVMQDFTGVPGIVDLAAMRSKVHELNGNVDSINPLVPVDLVTDHSVQVDFFGASDAVAKNLAMEYQRNGERYSVLKWAQRAFRNLRIFPPGAGIVHQVNLEYIADVVSQRDQEGKLVAFPDTLVGTDSHTTMINGLGVMGWGVGGIEAEAVMLGQPYFMKIPEVIGLRLIGKLREGVTATDLVLTVTELLRKENVVEKFVEYFGVGIKNLSVPDRATLSNMSPEYGATMGFFPIDEKTIDYLRFTGRDEAAELVEAYTKRQALFFVGDEEPAYTKVLELDISKVEPCVAGPTRPQDRIVLSQLKSKFNGILEDNQSVAARKNAESKSEAELSAMKKIPVTIEGQQSTLTPGAVVIAAITSCTNTSNPSVLVGAGLLARNAVRAGLNIEPYVKTSFAPGSKVVVEYLKKAGLLDYLEQLKFHVVGFGCTTCIGNSGPLIPEVEQAILENKLVVSSILSGNRNFEARIHPNVRANFLASPMLVVAFALAGTMNIDIMNDPIGTGKDGKKVFLKDIWPSNEEIAKVVNSSVSAQMFHEKYADILEGDTNWQNLNVTAEKIYQWDAASTYIRNPPFFSEFSKTVVPPENIKDAKIIALFGDTVTTDHISPAGAIPQEYPAGQYLLSAGVTKENFNSFGSRRGNHEVMMRGTFGNVRIKNHIVTPKEGGWTKIFPENKEEYIYDAAMTYLKRGKTLVVLGGKEYGTGSSRDWAAKGTILLGIKAVIAESFERIHRNNLIGMGVLPLVFVNGQGWKKLGITGEEDLTIHGIESITPGKMLTVNARRPDGTLFDFTVKTRLDTDIEVDYYQHGGILTFVLRKLLAKQ